MYVIGPLVGRPLNRMAALVVTAVDQHVVNPHLAQLTERDLLRAGGHGPYLSARECFENGPSNALWPKQAGSIRRFVAAGDL
jgi:hypothetical protein